MKKFLYLLFFALILFCISCRTSRDPFNPERKFPPETMKKDYRLFRNILEEWHPSLYWYISRDSLNYFFDKGYAQLNDSLTEPQFRTVLSFIVSKIGCGHTGIRYSKQFARYADTAKLPQFPLILKFWKDTMVVALNLNRKDSVLKRGMIIERINGWTTRRLEDTLFNYFITDGYNLSGKYQYLSTGLNFSTWYKNVLGYSEKFTIDYRDSGGISRQVIVPLYNPKADTVKRIFKRPVQADAEPPRKRRKEIDRYYTRNLQIDSSLNTAFMSLNTFEPGNHLGWFFRNSFRSLDKSHVANLVIDVRSNGGGDATNSTLLTRYIINRKFRIADSLYALRRHSPYDKYIGKSFLYRLLMNVVTSKRSDSKYHFGYFERHYYHPIKKHHFNGQVYILTGGNSFSATSLFAGAVKGQHNVTLVGEETGGGYYGNTAWMIPDVTLPNTKVRFRLPRFRLVVDKNREKNGKGVPPDVPALPNADAIGKGLDFKAAKVKELIRLHAAAEK